MHETRDTDIWTYKLNPPKTQISKNSLVDSTSVDFDDILIKEVLKKTPNYMFSLIQYQSSLNKSSLNKKSKWGKRILNAKVKKNLI